MSFRFKTLSDINKIPSVLDSNELNYYFEKLLDFVNGAGNLNPIDVASTLFDLITYEGPGGTGLNSSNSERAFSWVRHHYDSNDFELVEWMTAVLANLQCDGIKNYTIDHIKAAESAKEREELRDILREISR